MTCTGYDAEVIKLVIHLENTSETFTRAINNIKSSKFITDRIQNISMKYQKSNEEIIQRLKEYHLDYRSD